MRKYRIIFKGERKDWADCWHGEKGEVIEYICAENDDDARRQLKLLKINMYPDYYVHGRLLKRYTIIEFIELRPISFVE
jgi:hypothetical protein